MKKAITAFAAAAALLGASAASLAETVTVGDLVIESPRARATPPGAPVSGGYMMIRNNGDKPDRLVGGSAPFAGKVEIHEMSMQDDVMKMRQLENGLEIPPGGMVTLKPGGFHVMFMQMKQNLQAGERQKVMLRFRDAGEVEVDFDVVTPDKLKMKMD